MQYRIKQRCESIVPPAYTATQNVHKDPRESLKRKQGGATAGCDSWCGDVGLIGIPGSRRVRNYYRQTFIPFFLSPPAVLPSIESRSLGTRQESRKAEGTRSTDNNFGSARIRTTNEPASIRIIISCIIHDSLERPAEIIVSST